ncbi:MAG: hypothetical protein HY319_18945, partial [Armatimonadetes bacterium]|nr:hypothetical protein [Armatimonadota bacterium]
MKVTSINQPESRTYVQVSEKPSSSGASNRGAIEIGNQQNGNSGVEGTFSTRATALSTNNGVNRVLSEVLGDRASEASNPSQGAASAASYRSSTPVPLEGYDQGKLDNPNHRTPKYIFGRVARNYKLDSVQGDKAKAEELLRAMVPELRENGLEVVAVKGDRIQVKTEVGYEWVDVIRGAGSDNPGWWWGSEGKGTPQPTATVQEWAAAI